MSRARSRINRSRPAVAAVLVLTLTTWAWGQQPVLDVTMVQTPAANCVVGVVNYAFAGPVVGAGLNRLGIVIALSQGIAENAVDWGFTRMASLGNMGGAGTGWNSRIYYVSMPPSGSSTITVYTMVPASPYFWGVYAFAGVSQANPLGAQTSASGTGTQFTETTGVGGGVNTLHFDSMNWSGNPTYTEPAVVQGTQAVQLNPTLTRPCTGNNAGWGSATAGGASPVFAWRNGGNQNWAGGNRTINGGVAAGACGQLPLVGAGC